jgi:hypothetical protein
MGHLLRCVAIMCATGWNDVDHRDNYSSRNRGGIYGYYSINLRNFQNMVEGGIRVEEGNVGRKSHLQFKNDGCREFTVRQRKKMFAPPPCHRT